jgi:threonine/homoserine/homoserine lactone efflux protein
MLAIVVAPGADTVFVVASAARGGSRSGVIAALGIIGGGTVHISLATAGLSTLILKSAIAFAILKYLGAAYLLYLGIRTIAGTSTSEAAHRAQGVERSPYRVFRQGFLTNVLNPKVPLFVVAFFPQFVSPARGPVWSQIMEMGVLWYGAGLVWYSLVAVCVGRVRRAAVPVPAVRRIFKYVVGGIFIALGIRVALPD